MYVRMYACVDNTYTDVPKQAAPGTAWVAETRTKHNGKDRHLSTACLSGLLKFYNRITYVLKKPKLHFKKSQNGSTLQFVQFFLQIVLTHT